MPRRWIAALVGWRLLWLALPLAFAASSLWPFSVADFAANFHRPADTPPHLATRWATWDGQHYLEIAEHGYVAGRVSSAFWPLWPTAVRLVAPLTGGSYLPAALLAALLFSILGLVGFTTWVREREESPAASGALFALLAFPSAFYLGLPYSEALFLALAAGLLLAIDRRRLALAALAAFALTLTRPVGLFVLPALVAALSRFRSAGASRGARLLLVASPLVGVAAYALIHLLLTGDPRGALGVRGVFVSGQSLSRLLDPIGLVTSFFRIDALHSIRGSLLDRLAFVAVVATFPALWRRDRIAFWYALPMALVPAMTLHYMAFTRFALAVLPAFWILGRAWSPERPHLRRLAWVLAALGLVLQLWLYARHTANLWAG
ncbi:MAG: hypothetical protein R2862_07105 [Thermoanaerobaculia bacterium]